MRAGLVRNRSTETASIKAGRKSREQGCGQAPSLGQCGQEAGKFLPWKFPTHPLSKLTSAPPPCPAASPSLSVALYRGPEELGADQS